MGSALQWSLWGTVNLLRWAIRSAKVMNCDRDQGTVTPNTSSGRAPLTIHYPIDPCSQPLELWPPDLWSDLALLRIPRNEPPCPPSSKSSKVTRSSKHQKLRPTASNCVLEDLYKLLKQQKQFAKLSNWKLLSLTKLLRKKIFLRGSEELLPLSHDSTIA